MDSSGAGLVSRECNFIYKKHKSAITDLCSLESQNWLASADGSLHVGHGLLVDEE